MTSNQVISKIVYNFWRALDLGEHDRAASLLTADCVWYREVILQGREAILEALQQRPANMLTRHQVTNLMIVGDDASTAEFLVTTFGTMVSEGQAGPPDCGTPAVIVDVAMRFECVEDQNLICEIRNHLVFLRPRVGNS